MANQNLSNQIFLMVEREAILFCQQTMGRNWASNGSYRKFRSGHLFGVCLALKALRVSLVTDGERREMVRQLQADVRYNCFAGDHARAERWMHVALGDAKRGKFRKSLVALKVEWIFRPRPKKNPTSARPAPTTNSQPKTPALQKAA